MAGGVKGVLGLFEGLVLSLRLLRMMVEEE